MDMRLKFFFVNFAKSLGPVLKDLLNWSCLVSGGTESPLNPYRRVLIAEVLPLVLGIEKGGGDRSGVLLPPALLHSLLFSSLGGVQ